MANGSQQGGGILDTIEGGLGKILPYAIPIGLGAAMGAPVGMGLAGAAAGLGEAEGAAGERQQRQQELAMQQQRLQLEAQAADLELKKAKVAFQNEDERQAYAKSIKDPTQRQMYLESPSTYFANQQWQSFAGILAKDPTFSTSHPELAKELAGLPPQMGQKLLEAAMSGKFTNGVKGVVNPDGTYTYYGLGPIGPDGQPSKTAILTGVVPKTVTGAPPPEKPPDPKALVANFRMMHPPPPLPSAGIGGKIKGLFADNSEKYAGELADYLTSNGVDEDKAKSIARSAVGLSGSKADPNKGLKPPTLTSKSGKKMVRDPKSPTGYSYAE